jgi:hypothetical protein
MRTWLRGAGGVSRHRRGAHGDDWRELAADDKLRPVRDPVFGRRVSREFRNMARKLRRSLRRGVERRAVS